MDIDWLFRGSGLVLGMVGLWLIYWFLLADRAKGRKRCPKCWYDMATADSLRCSECGHDAKREANLLKTRRRFKGLWLCLLVFLVASFLWIQPKVKQDGWASVMPNTVLIYSLRLPENDWAFDELLMRTTTTLEKPYSHVGMHDSDKLFRWQWRLVGNVCIDMVRDDYENPESGVLFDWLYRASISVPAEDGNRFFRATISFLADDDQGIRDSAAYYCVSFAEFADEANARFAEETVEAIRPLLDDQNQQVRLGVILCLRVMGHYSATPVPVLVEALKHDDGEVRASAAAQLGSIAKINEEPTEAFEILVDIYRSDSDVQVQANALQAICMFESQREQAPEFIREAFSSTESVLRVKAIQSLITMVPFDSMEPFDEAFDLEITLKGLNDEDAGVRSRAAWLLKHKRTSTDSLRPHQEYLREFVDSDNEDVRRAVIMVLKRIQDAIED